MKKMTYQDFRAVMDKMDATAPYAASYALGAMQFLLADAASKLTKADQAELVRSLESLAKTIDEKYNSKV